MIFRSLICIVILFASFVAPAQEQKKLSWNDQFILDKCGKPFPIQDSFITLNKKVYDFRVNLHPSFVYISSESCIPCKFELPLYLEACRQYPDFDFVYFTTDPDTVSIKNKLGGAFNLPNLYIVMKPYDYFYENQLMLGFPTKYFINSKQKVETVQLGGYMVKEKVQEEWVPVLTHLQ